MSDPQSYRPSNIPTDPGVYRFFDAENRVIYVGKAKNLRNRLNSYFQSNLQEKTYRMVHTAVKVDWTIVKSEIEALQLEFTWIKKENPKFNVQFRDDKSYPYLGISLSEDFPRLFITRNEHKKGFRYFGPYAHAWALRTTFDLLQALYPIRTCTDGNFQRAQRSKRQCLLGDIGKCSAPCVEWISQEEHKNLAKELIHFVDISPDAAEENLEKLMAEASAHQEYERAAKYRDQLVALRRANETAGTFISNNVSGDFISIYRDITHAAATIFTVRFGRIVGSRSWVVDLKDTLENEGIGSLLLMQIYSEVEIPRDIYLNEAIENDIDVTKHLVEKSGHAVEIHLPMKGEKFDLLQTVRRNAQENLIQFLSKRSSDSGVSGRALEEISVALNLPEAPLRIECFDISNTQGTNSVASMVVFEDGQAKKSDYRRFAIEGDQTLDDSRAIAQVISRRFKRYLKEREIDESDAFIEGAAGRRFAYPPQLVVVDGGKPQVNAAAKALAELGISDVVLCGLAKRLEEVWLPDHSDPMILPRHSEGLYLLQRIRDEAHRFAITYHRSKRSRMMLESMLDEMPGLGHVRRSALLQHFGSVAALKKVELAELAKVPGIGQKTAEMIYFHLHRQDLEPHLPVDMHTGEILDN